jgi:hypothetical protein
MKDVVKKEIIHDLGTTIKILEVKEAHDIEKLKGLSDHAVENVAVHKDLDLISVTVLIYSIYKIWDTISNQNYQKIISEFKEAKQNIEQNQFGPYNSNIRKLFQLVRASNAKVKVHLQDVMDAARIKKGSVLLGKGLSVGQAAGLMGLTNWDLQGYASRTTAMEHSESIPAKKRLQTALALFGVSK